MSKYTESFGKWFNPFDEKLGQASKVEAIQYAFEYQQSKIKELLERLRECEEKLKALNFHCSEYGLKEESFAILMACEKACEYFKKYEGLNDNK